MDLKIRKIYIDTRFKRGLYGSNTNFEIELPQTVECPEQTVMFVDEVVMPNTMTTIQQGVNDVLYFAVFYSTVVQYNSITFPEQNYTLMYFADQLKTLMNAKLNTSESEFNVSYNIDKLTISISLTDKRSNKPDVMRWQIFSDDNLKAGFFASTPIYNPLTCNEILQNFVVDPSATWPANDTIVNYNIDLHSTRNLYLLADIGEYRTLTNFQWSGSSVIKKIQMNVPYNETLFSNVIMPYDCSHVSLQSFNRIKFRLVNSKGQEPNLKNNWSFSIIFSVVTL
jgi:hypothetical protein